MASGFKIKKRDTRKRLFSFITVGVLGLHALVFLLLAQCGGIASGNRNEVSYINVNFEEKTDLTLDFEAPPKRMFYQYATAPLSVENEEPQPISVTQWDGYETLVALKVDEYSSMENYRLTLESVEEPEPRGRRTLGRQQIFRTVLLSGVPVQPISTVPEPSSIILLSVTSLFLMRRQRRS